jgi:hypothetical protein
VFPHLCGGGSEAGEPTRKERSRAIERLAQLKAKRF